MKYSFLLITLILSTSLNGQNPQWINYSSGIWVNCVCPHGPILWTGTNGGLIKINTLTSETTFYNRGNSDIPDNRIIDIAIDGTDQVWIATEAGVTIYNELGFINYDTSSFMVPGNVVNSIYATTNSEAVFICTNKGYTKFTGIYHSIIDTTNSELPDNDVTIVRYDNNNVLWIGTKNGLARKDINNWTIYNNSNSALQGNQISALAVDQDNIIWAGTWMTGGLVSFDGTEWTDWSDIHYALSNQIPVIYVDSDNRKWMGTPHEGIMILDGNDLTLWEFGSGIPSVYIHDITQNESGDMYVASGFGGGLLKLQNNNWFIIETSNTGFLSFSNRIQSVSVAPNNGVFFGVTNHGLTEFNSTTWVNYETYADHINAIHTTNEGTTWLGTSDGLGKITNGYISIFGDNPILSISSETDNSIWYGGYNYLFMNNGDEYNNYTTSNSGIQPGPYGTIAVDQNNTKWIGSYAGLSSFDDENWQIYDISNSNIPFEGISSISVDTNNFIWIGGWGIARFDGTDWLYYNEENSGLPDNYVNSIVIDDKNKLWIGTLSGGMSSYDGSIWETFSVNNSGIPYNEINQIDIDLNNNKWIATPRGLGVYNKGGVILNLQKRSLTLNHFSVKPNPANDYFYLQSQQEIYTECKVLIYNLKGQLIKTMPNINLNEKISTNNLQNGLYLLEIQSGNKTGFAKVMVHKS